MGDKRSVRLSVTLTSPSVPPLLNWSVSSVRRPLLCSICSFVYISTVLKYITIFDTPLISFSTISLYPLKSYSYHLSPPPLKFTSVLPHLCISSWKVLFLFYRSQVIPVVLYFVREKDIIENEQAPWSKKV